MSVQFTDTKFGNRIEKKGMEISPSKVYYGQYTSPQNNISTTVNDISQDALTYWENYLSTKGEATKAKYSEYFKEFLRYINKNPNELIAQRQQDLLNQDIKIQRQNETQFLNFLALKKKQGYSIATQQIYFASIRSFFEAHYFPLRMRRGDYPKGDSDGVKRATKEAILNILNQDTRNQTTINAMIMIMKDSGLRVRLLLVGERYAQGRENVRFQALTGNMVKPRKTLSFFKLAFQ